MSAHNKCGPGRGATPGASESCSDTNPSPVAHFKAEAKSGDTGHRSTRAAELAQALGARRSGAGWMARCPCHDDTDPSLAISNGRNGGPVIHCHAGCSQEAVIAELRRRGLWHDQPNGRDTLNIVGRYPYVDENETLLFEVCRLEPKAFRQRRPDGRGGWTWRLGNVRRVLYRLPQLIEAVALEQPIFICEGEKDVNNLIAWHIAATCNPGGAGKWRSEYNEHLHGADVVIIADNDEPGKKHALDVAASLTKHARVRILETPSPHKDISEWIDAGGTPEALFHLVDEQAKPWTGQAKESRDDDAELSDHAAGRRRPTQADILIDIARAAELFHKADGTGFADLDISGHRETWPIRSKGFRRWLAQRFFEATKGAPNSEALQSALNVIEAMAHFDAPERIVHVRVGGLDGKLYLDLCDETWRSVEIDATGWRVIGNPPVRFRRAAGMQALPAPVAGGSVEALRSFLNVRSDADFILVVAWTLACLRNHGPYPVLTITGEQGSTKSTFCAILRALVDPNTAPLRALPREDRDLFIAANNGYLLAFDNVSGLPAWISDTLCRLSTGGGFAVRQLYSDSDETLFDACRPVILNGIEDFVSRPDLADRSMFLVLDPIPEERRRPERELLLAFEAERPRILGALLSAVARGLSMLPHTRLDKLPRMADFSVWAVACSPPLWPGGTFLAAYCSNRDAMVGGVIEADMVAGAVRALLSGRADAWMGTATELLGALAAKAGESAVRARSWPSNPRALAGRLRRCAPALRAIGISIEFTREGPAGTRVIRISTAEPPSPDWGAHFASEPSASSEPLKINRLALTVTDGADANSDGTDATGPGNPGEAKLLSEQAFCRSADGTDGADAHPPNPSGTAWKARL